MPEGQWEVGEPTCTQAKRTPGRRATETQHLPLRFKAMRRPLMGEERVLDQKLPIQKGGLAQEPGLSTAGG